jgi:hypothetical protein
MKKVLLGLVLVLLPLFASAQTREALLTNDGTLFTIEQQWSSEHPEVETNSASYLLLTRRAEDGTISRQILPATLTSGGNSSPALAYDNDSHTLFAFWIHDARILDSELLFASMSPDGVWSDASAFGDKFDFRENLRIAVTRRVSPDSEEVDGVASSGISVHATWWEFDMHTGIEAARYAMISIDGGHVASVDYVDLDAFVDHEIAPVEGVDNYTLLKQPLLFPSPKQDSVLIVFGDLSTQSFSEVRVTPTRPPIHTEGRLRVPVGRKVSGFAGPGYAVSANSEVGGIYQDGDSIALYTKAPDKVQYLVHKDGGWSNLRTVVLDDEISAPTAIDAVRKFLHEN